MFSNFCCKYCFTSSSSSSRFRFAFLFFPGRSFSSSSKPAAKQFRRDVLSDNGGKDKNGNSSSELPEFSDARLAFPADHKFAAVELIPRDPEKASNPLRIPLVWLRDHCRSAAAYNSRTNQRRSECTDLFARARLADDCYPIHFDADAQRLKLCWADGAETHFGMSDLIRWALFSKKRFEECPSEEWEGGPECPSRTLWHGDRELREIPSLSITQFDFALFARLLIRFGVVSVSGVNAGDERATRELCQSISPLFGTIFGDFWTFGPSLDSQNGMASHDDTAYGSEAIGPHTDGTYLDQPPGIQVFHCLRPALQDGRTILVDGFAVAERLRAESAKLFGALSSTVLEHEYLEAQSYHARAFREPVIRQFPGAEKIAQIRFNPYDRAPMRTLKMDDGAQNAMEETVLFYEAYQRFAQLVNDPAHQALTLLRPGTVIFIDNFRVLHGRKAFQGERLICGCYLNRDVLLAKARPRLSPNLYRNV